MSSSDGGVLAIFCCERGRGDYAGAGFIGLGVVQGVC